MSSREKVVATIKVKGTPGRKPKSPEEKRKSVLMLRLNTKEREHLDRLVLKSGWTGDRSSYVRDRIMSEGEARGVQLGLDGLDRLLFVLHSYVEDLSEELGGEHAKEFDQINTMVKEIMPLIYRAE